MKVIVMDFESFGVPEVTATYLTDKLRGFLLDSGQYLIVSEETTQKTARHKKLDIDDCFDDGCVTLLGESVSADKALLGTLSKSGASYLLTLRMVDIKDKKVTSMVTQECLCSEEMLPILVKNTLNNLLESERKILAGQDLAGKIPKLKIALMDLQDLGVSEAAAYSISDVIRSQLFAHNFIDIIDRSTMNKILKENDFSLADCTSSECAQQVGKLLNVEKIILGTFGRLGRKYSLSLKMVDTNSGEVIAAVGKAFYCQLEELSSYVKFLADKLVVGKISGKTAGLIVFSPLESRVYLEDEFRGEIKNSNQPLNLVGLTPGIYNLKIDRIDGTEETGSVILREGESVSFPSSRSIVPDLSKTKGSRLSASALALISHPSGASIFINGIYKGVTPLLLVDLEPQFYEVKLLHKRHKESVDYIFVPEKKLVSIEKFLRPAEQILFVSDRDGNREIYRIDSDGDNLTRLTYEKQDDYSPAWAPDGSGYVFISNRDNPLKSNLYYSEINSAEAVALTNEFDKVYSPSFNPTGNEILFLGLKDEEKNLYVIDKNGENLRRLKDIYQEIVMPSWAPNGRQIAFVSDHMNSSEIFLLDLADMKSYPITDNYNAWNGYPAWNYNSKQIAYISKGFTDDYDDIIIKDTVSGREKVILDELIVAISDPSWSADGRQIIYTSVNAEGNSDLYIINSGDGSNKVRLTNHVGYDGEPAWMPPDPVKKNLLPTAKPTIGKVKKFREFERATIIIEYEPKGADVYIDGVKYNDVTPITIHNLKYGLHNIVLMTEKYIKWGLIDVREGDNLFNISLQKKKSVVEIISEPLGVTVYADGRNMGTTPLTFSVMWGLHNFRFSKSGYVTKEQSFYAEPLKMNKIKLLLEKM